MKKDENNRISLKSTLLDALKQMDLLRVKSLLVFNDEKFVCLLTIGDIQRAIISNISLTTLLESAVNTNKEYASEADSLDSIKNKMMAIRAECMPVLDSNGNLINVYYWNDLFTIKQVDSKKKLNIPVVIMAGGKGTRLKPLTNIIPKPLIPIGEKTILEIIMDQFEGIGCSKFYISVNYKAEILKYYINNLPHKYDIECFKEDTPLGTIGSVSLLIDKLNTPFFVSNCDIIIDQDFRDVYEYHCENQNDITIIAALKVYQIPYGVIETGETGIMTALNEKPELTYMINTGVYILEPHLIDKIPENQFFHITDLIEKVRGFGGKVGVFPVSEKSWTDIGDWNEYLKLIEH
jgi:dTDP-glucose pyrophosphorylase